MDFKYNGIEILGDIPYKTKIYKLVFSVYDIRIVDSITFSSEKSHTEIIIWIVEVHLFHCIYHFSLFCFHHQFIIFN